MSGDPNQGWKPAYNPWLIAITVTLAAFMEILDTTIVNVALPVMAKDLAVKPADAIFVVNAYQIAVTASLLPFASLGDIFGFRRVYLPGLVVFVAASLACAVAPNLSLLIVGRIVQGLGAAAIMSVNIGFVRFIYPHRMIGQGVANVALVVAVASAAGPTVAAAILSVATWPWLFLVNIPVGLLALAVATHTLPVTPASGRRFDWVSAVLNALTFGLLIIGIDGLGDPEGQPVAVAELVGAVVIGTVFVRRQIRLPAPLLPVDLLRIPAFALSMATSVASFCAQMVSYVALPFYFQDVLHLSSTKTGFLLTPWPIAVAAMAPISGRLADRYPPGLLGGIGLAMLAAGLVCVTLLPEAPATLDIVWRLTLCGLGFGLFQSPNNRIIITSAPRHRSGGASGMQSTARLTGQSLGAAGVAVIFGVFHGGTSQSVTAALWCAAGLAALGSLASVLRRPTLT